jgi:hypothetical protein
VKASNCIETKTKEQSTMTSVSNPPFPGAAEELSLHNELANLKEKQLKVAGELQQLLQEIREKNRNADINPGNELNKHLKLLYAESNSLNSRCNMLYRKLKAISEENEKE